MARKRIRLAYNAKADVNVTEYLRYAGIICVDGDGRTASLPYLLEKTIRGERKPGEVTVIMECPQGLNRDIWVKQNTDRLSSFMVKAYVWNE